MSATKLCECGCGQPAPIAPYALRSKGWVGGQPLRFVHGHNGNSPVETRFWNRTKETGTGCWEWQGARNEHNYGGVSVNGKWRKAHQVAWELAHGERPEGACVCHRCDNPPCVNPAHLFLGSQIENIQDMHNKGRARGGSPIRPRNTKTHCPQNHPYEGDNLIVTKEGYFRCRTCVRAQSNANYRKRKAVAI